MRTFTTLFDIHYLDRALVLYESIGRFLADFRIYCLCLDDSSFERIKRVDDDRLIPLHIKEEFYETKDFMTLVKHNESVPISKPAKKGKVAGLSDFHFALASFFTHYIMEKELPEDVLYVDSDIMFYSSPDLIFDSVEGKSIGIIRHRHNKVGCGVGGYNVGVIYFRNDEIGRRCLKWWRDVVMDKSNEWFPKYGFCGDQKYLELFESMFGNVKVLDDDIGHGAPWNLKLYEYFDDKMKIRWEGKIQTLVFIHFSHFNYTKDSYRAARRKEWSIYEPARRYYKGYFETLKSVRRRYKL